MRRLLLLLALIAGFAVVPGASPATAAQKDPILFVHGFSGGEFNWWQMKGRFESDGWRAYNWQYDSNQSNVTTAYQIRDKVNAIKRETGAAKVDIVSHSMGALSSRFYLKNLGGQTSVDDFVSIGGPNHGTAIAFACFTTSCVEMRQGSNLLNYLNSGDETPNNEGPTKYGTFWSYCDEIINPDESTPLNGAYNTMVGCYGHLSLLGSWNVYTQVRSFVTY